MTIHPTAVVSPSARIGPDVSVGPLAIIESHAVIGQRSRIESRATIKTGTVLGTANYVGEGAVLGGRPQHLQAGDVVGQLVVGDHNTIREFATLHVGLHPFDITQIGSHNLIMVGAHVGHDCRIGDGCVIANNVLLGGHVTVDDQAYLSGAVAVHQFCRIGRHAMVGGQAHVNKDVPPFVTVDGVTSRLVGLNQIGLRRKGFDVQAIRQLKEAYRIAFLGNLPWREMLATLEREFPIGAASMLWKFLSQSKRGWLPDRRGAAAETIPFPVVVERGTRSPQMLDQRRAA